MTDPREAEAREVLARAYEKANDAPFGAGQRFHAANVRAMDKRDYADWKDRAAIAAMLAFADREREAMREACAQVAESRHEHWRMPHPDDANPGEVCCDVSACRDIAAAIRNLPSGK